MRFLRSGWVLFIIALSATLLSAAGGIWLAASRIDADALSQAIARMTGHEATALGQSEVRLLPALTVTFRDFALHRAAEPAQDRPLLAARKVQFNLSPWAAMGGRMEITGVVFTDADIFAELGPDGLTFAIGPGSRLATAALMRRLQPEAGQAFGASRGGLFPETSQWINSRLVLQDAADGQELLRVEAIDMELRLPRTDPSAMLFGSARINGEAAAVRLRAGDLVGLLAGEETSLNTSITSDVIEASLEGRGGLQPQPFFAGRAAFSTPSLARATEWIGWMPPVKPSDMPVRITGTVTANGGRIDMVDLSLRAGGNAGRGALSFVPGQAPASVSGSLDFEELDVEAFVRSYLEPAFGGTQNGDGEGLNLDLDLRFSARSARLAGVALANVAATTRITAGMASLDVNNASVFGGTAQIALKADRTASPQSVELRVLAEGIQTQALAPVSGIVAQHLDTAADASIILEGPWISLPSFLMSAKGSLKFNTRDGALSGISLPDFAERISEGGLAPVDGLAGGSIRFNEMLGEADIADGVVRLGKFRSGLPQAAVTVSGSHSVAGGNLALAGTLTLEARHPLAQGEAKTLPFFVGGSLSAPFLSSIAPKTAP